jgi:GAF domain-containing protein
MMLLMTHHGDDSLSHRMARAARELLQQQDPQATMQRAVELAVVNVRGCDFAGLSFVQARRDITTRASTGELVADADRLQYETREGPCLDAIWERQTIYSADLGEDPRWPTWGPRVEEETGARSVLAFQLFTNEDTLGALNLYSRAKDGFDDADRDDGLALAAHIAIAVAGALEAKNLSAALDSRTVIGQASGIVMERFDVTPHVAFAVLSRVSQHENVKLREVAQEIVATRKVPSVDESP